MIDYLYELPIHGKEHKHLGDAIGPIDRTEPAKISQQVCLQLYAVITDELFFFMRKLQILHKLRLLFKKLFSNTWIDVAKIFIKIKLLIMLAMKLKTFCEKHEYLIN